MRVILLISVITGVALARQVTGYISDAALRVEQRSTWQRS
jgi:hypothetical protein